MWNAWFRKKSLQSREAQIVRRLQTTREAADGEAAWEVAAGRAAEREAAAGAAERAHELELRRLGTEGRQKEQNQGFEESKHTKLVPCFSEKEVDDFYPAFESARILDAASPNESSRTG